MDLQRLLLKTDHHFILLYCNIDTRSVQFFFSFLLFNLRIAHFTEVRFKQFIFMDNTSLALMFHLSLTLVSHPRVSPQNLFLGSHRKVPPQVSTLKSHLGVKSQGSIVGSHLRVLPQGPTLRLHLKVLGTGSLFSGMPLLLKLLLPLLLLALSKQFLAALLLTVVGYHLSRVA